MKNFDNKVQFSLPKTPLPHNFVAEKIVLSCLLINYEAIEITIKTVRVETFYFINHQEIYKAIVENKMGALEANVPREQKIEGLNNLLSWFESREEYEKCGQLKNIIEKI